MLNLSTTDEKEQRLNAKNELGNFVALIVIEDEFLRAYVKRIFLEILDLKNTIECATPDEAKKYLDEHAGKNLSCIISSIDFLDGATGIDFLQFLRSSYDSVVAPFVLIGDVERTIEYVFLVEHFAGHIGQSFTPAEFISMLLEVFSVRDRRRSKRELANDAYSGRPFNKLYTGKKIDYTK